MNTWTPARIGARLDRILWQVQKPPRYTGGEHNSVVKDWRSVDVRWCLSYPDAYEVGQPNQGVAILYEILNERDWLMAERTFSIWPDAARMAEFARHMGPHAAAMQAARDNGWFAEELYARFHVLGSTGQWSGADPLAGAWDTERHAA